MGSFVLSWGPPRKRAEHEFLYQGRTYDVHRMGTRVWMHANDKWTRHLTAAVERYRVDELIVSHFCAKHGLEFLNELPGITRLSISLPLEPPDLRPVERMRNLERLAFSPGSLVSINAPAEFDFTALPRLIVCELSPWWPQWESALRCENLRALHITESRTLRTLDLSRLGKLSELVLGGHLKLTSFELAPAARVESMQLRSCNKLKPDWPRIGRDLLYLWLEKKPTYPLDELHHAKALKGLMLGYMRKLDSAEFLRGLPSLEWLQLLFTEFDRAGIELVRSMKHLKTDGLPIERVARETRRVERDDGRDPSASRVKARRKRRR